MPKRKKPRRQIVPTTKKQIGPASPKMLLTDVRSLIEKARTATAQAVNAALVMLNWQIGHRIRTEILKEKRAAYGEEILPTLSAKLVKEYGDGYSERNLARMIRFAEVFPEFQIVSAL